MEVLIYPVILVAVLTLLVGPLVLSLAAFVRSGRVVALARRVEQLESLVRELRAGRPGPLETESPVELTARPAPALVLESPTHVEISTAVEFPPAPAAASFDWEWFIGRRALGWVSVLLVFFAAAFFLRYAFEKLCATITRDRRPPATASGLGATSPGATSRS